MCFLVAVLLMIVKFKSKRRKNFSHMRSDVMDDTKTISCTIFFQFLHEKDGRATLFLSLERMVYSIYS